MNKYLIALLMFATFAGASVSPAQNHRHTPRTATASVTADTAGVTAFSDTTATDTSAVLPHTSGQINISPDDFDELFNRMSLFDEGVVGTILILFILFVLSPVLILGVLLYFIYKNRKQKMRLAEMAVKSGQPIPGDLLGAERLSGERLWRKGITNVFTGIGLIFLFIYMDFRLGIGIGFLVCSCGVGQAVIARTSASRRQREKELNEPEKNTDI